MSSAPPLIFDGPSGVNAELVGVLQKLGFLTRRRTYAVAEAHRFSGAVSSSVNKFRASRELARADQPPCAWPCPLHGRRDGTDKRLPSTPPPPIRCRGIRGDPPELGEGLGELWRGFWGL